MVAIKSKVAVMSVKLISIIDKWLKKYIIDNDDPFRWPCFPWSSSSSLSSWSWSHPYCPHVDHPHPFCWRPPSATEPCLPHFPCEKIIFHLGSLWVAVDHQWWLTLCKTVLSISRWSIIHSLMIIVIIMTTAVIVIFNIDHHSINKPMTYVSLIGTYSPSV